MRIEWVIDPLAQCLFLALALIACLGLFVSIKLEMAVFLRDFRKRREAPAVGGRTLTPSTRAQALQMQDRGESPTTIAAALGAPRNEIDLLFKIAGLLKGPSN
jgi:hypothetical protein